MTHQIDHRWMSVSSVFVVCFTTLTLVVPLWWHFGLLSMLNCCWTVSERDWVCWVLFTECVSTFLVLLSLFERRIQTTATCLYRHYSSHAGVHASWPSTVVFAMCSSTTFWPRHRQCEVTTHRILLSLVLWCWFCLPCVLSDNVKKNLQKLYLTVRVTILYLI